MQVGACAKARSGGRPLARRSAATAVPQARPPVERPRVRGKLPRDGAPGHRPLHGGAGACGVLRAVADAPRAARADRHLGRLGRLGAAAGWAGESLVAQLARRVEGGETVARLTIAGVGAGASLLRLDRRRPALALIGTGAAGGRDRGAGGLGGAGAAPRERLRPAADRRRGRAGLGGQALRAERAAPRPPAPALPLRRLPADDLVGPAGAGLRGPALLRRAPTTGLPVDPVRVFVGVKRAESVAERCDLAVAELERLGASIARAWSSARRRCAATSTRSRIAAEERFSGGDVAHVCVQYFDRRTPWLWRKVPIAAQTHRELLARLARARPGALRLRRVARRVGEQRATTAQASRDRDRPVAVGRHAVPSRFGPAADGRPRFQVVAHRATSRTCERSTCASSLLERLTDPVVLFPGLELLWRRPPGTGGPGSRASRSSRACSTWSRRRAGPPTSRPPRATTTASSCRWPSTSPSATAARAPRPRRSATRCWRRRRRAPRRSGRRDSAHARDRQHATPRSRRRRALIPISVSCSPIATLSGPAITVPTGSSPVDTNRS